MGANTLSVVALTLTSQRRAPLANQARALVVNGGLSPHEATALLLETACSILLTKPALSYER